MENDRASYRQTVRNGHMVVGYQTAPGSSGIDERALHHMTLWRMLGWLGGQLVALRTGLQLILERHPDSTCHRFVGAVAPHKFRSLERQRSLCYSRRLLHLSAEWEHRCGQPFFPRFATRAGFD